MNRWTLGILAGCTLASAAVAQDALKRKLTDKLAEPWVANADWITDFDTAKAKAKKSGKPIFGYFTRSYAP